MKIKNLVGSIALAFASIIPLAGCSPDAKVATENILKEGDSFKIMRRVVFYNGVTGDYILSIRGYCSMDVNADKTAFNVICKTNEGFKRHTMVLSDNTTAFVEQLDPARVSTQTYEVIFKPSVIIPDVRLN